MDLRTLNKIRPDVLRLLVEERQLQNLDIYYGDRSHINANLDWNDSRQKYWAWSNVNCGENFYLIDEWIKEYGWKPSKSVEYEGRRLLLSDDAPPPVGTILYPGPDFDKVHDSYIKKKFPVTVVWSSQFSVECDDGNIYYLKEDCKDFGDEIDGYYFLFTYEPPPVEETSIPTNSGQENEKSLLTKDQVDLLLNMYPLSKVQFDISVQRYYFKTVEQLNLMCNCLKSLGFQPYGYFNAPYPGYTYLYVDNDDGFFWISSTESFTTESDINGAELLKNKLLNLLNISNEQEQQPQTSTSSRPIQFDIPAEAPAIISRKIPRGSAISGGRNEATIASRPVGKSKTALL